MLILRNVMDLITFHPLQYVNCTLSVQLECMLSKNECFCGSYVHV